MVIVAAGRCRQHLQHHGGMVRARGGRVRRRCLEPLDAAALALLHHLQCQTLRLLGQRGNEGELVGKGIGHAAAFPGDLAHFLGDLRPWRR